MKSIKCHCYPLILISAEWQEYLIATINEKREKKKQQADLKSCKLVDCYTFFIFHLTKKWRTKRDKYFKQNKKKINTYKNPRNEKKNSAALEQLNC